jgi:Heterokaryon incompatibility protein (HET)
MPTGRAEGCDLSEKHATTHVPLVFCKLGNYSSPSFYARQTLSLELRGAQVIRMSRDHPVPPSHYLRSSSSPHHAPEFAYFPLESGQIRLVELLPGSRGSPIDCNLVHSSHQYDSEHYECLSYMWGSPLNPQSISMDGRIVHVRRNLRDALEAIRPEIGVKPRRVWIDALCINQKDVDERNTQVARMGRIFHNAAKVLVWLGQVADDSDFLFEHIKPRHDWRYDWAGPLDRRSLLVLLAFDGRPYWKRVWIIQELLSARSIDLFCGSKCISMDTYRWGFTSFVERLRTLGGDGLQPAWVMDGVFLMDNSPGRIILRQQYDGKTEDFSLLRLLEMCAKCKSECQLVHDRIYGLIGILKLSQQGLIVPDYSKPLSEVYADVFISLIVPDTASDSHYVTLWGYMGKSLTTSSRTVQHLLEYPLWNEEASAFHPLETICTISQLNHMRILRLDVWMEGVGAISEVGDAVGLLANGSPDLSLVDAMQKKEFYAALKHLEISHWHCTEKIGTQYTKELTSLPTTLFSPIEDENTGQEILRRRSTGQNRAFITRNGLLGFASSSIQKGDLLYGFNSLADLFLDTQNLFLIIRPGTNNSVYSFTLVGRAIMLPVPEERYCDFDYQKKKGKYANLNFKNDLITEGEHY